MNFQKIGTLSLAFLFASAPVIAQQGSHGKTSVAPQKTAPAKPAAPSSQPAQNTKPDKAAAYYHFALGHMYEESMAMYGQSDYATKAIEEYKKAIQADPTSDFLNAQLAGLYARTGRVRDAVLEAQDILKRDPNNVLAHKLLGRIYLHSLGDPEQGTQSREVLKLAIEQYQALAKLDPKDADNLLLLGRLYILNKDYKDAETEFKTAMNVDPTSEEAVTNLALLYNEQGDNQKAAEVLNSVPEPNRTSKMYAALGYTYEQQKNYKQAIAAYKQAVQLDKENVDAMRGLAENLANDNQTDAALSEYQMVEDTDPQDPQAPLRMAEIDRRMGKFDLAMENLKKAEALSQDSIEIPYNEAMVLEAQGRYDDAASTLQKLLARTTSPDGNYSASERNNRTLFLERLGAIYREADRPAVAVETYRKIIDLGGDEAARGYADLIDTYRDQKQWTDADRTAHEALQKFPKDKNLKMAMALQLVDDGKPDDAIRTAKSALTGGPDDRDTYVQISQIYARLKRWKDAENTLGQAQKLAVRPEEKEYIQFVLGSVYERQKKYTQAEQAFRDVLQMDPNNSQTLNYLGYMLADRNTHLEEALTLIKHAVQLDPQNGAYLDSLGWAYFRLGKYDQAEENLRRAADKTPNDPTVQDHLAQLYAKTGKLKLAETHWERALNEWSRSVPADVDQQDVSRVQKKLETTKVKLAQQQTK
ncbi:MAG TPA: tetratricopeptide repeat protein [Candidatus Angelobacter sp.]|nr:tetratricopeptide repeat protein [Candidatus Angelobacter sp.]